MLFHTPFRLSCPAVSKGQIVAFIQMRAPLRGILALSAVWTEPVQCCAFYGESIAFQDALHKPHGCSLLLYGNDVGRDDDLQVSLS